MGAPTLEGEIVSKIVGAVEKVIKIQDIVSPQGIVSSTLMSDIRVAVEAVIEDYFDGDVFLIEDTPVKGESFHAYRSRVESIDPYPKIGAKLPEGAEEFKEE